MVRILSLLLCSHEGGSCCTMVSVRNIESRNAGKDLSDAVNVSLIVDYPEVMAETILCNEVIFRLLCDIACYYAVDFLVVRVCEEYRLDVGVLDANMDHAVLFLVLAGKLVLLDST